jgi:hypothetical protein
LQTDLGQIAELPKSSPNLVFEYAHGLPRLAHMANGVMNNTKATVGALGFQFCSLKKIAARTEGRAAIFLDTEVLTADPAINADAA